MHAFCFSASLASAARMRAYCALRGFEAIGRRRGKEMGAEGERGKAEGEKGKAVF
mgnify:CR=1 FL=1